VPGKAGTVLLGIILTTTGFRVSVLAVVVCCDAWMPFSGVCVCATTLDITGCKSLILAPFWNRKSYSISEVLCPTLIDR
jgi:hypothetical protein